MNKRMAILISLLLIPAAFGLNAQAEDNENTKVEVYVITEENLTAFFNGTAINGSVSYFIDGIEVKGEFISIWKIIEDLKQGISSNHQIATFALSQAGDAWKLANENNDTLGEHSYTLAVHYDTINDTYNKLYLLKDEVVAFEDHYLIFENKTNTTLNAQENQINSLQAELDDLNCFVVLIRNALIGIVIASLVLYVVNRKYPLGRIIIDKKPVLTNGKQYKILDYTKKPRRTLKYMITHIRVNKEKSPLKFLFS